MIGFLVSSNTDYAAPLARLLMSVPSTIATRDVVAVVGGHVARSEHQIIVRQMYVDHRSYDYTALIDFVEHPGDYPAWSHIFLLQDTMELGAAAGHLISQADLTLDATSAGGAECNLGLYRVDYLRSRAAEIVALKNCSKLRSVEAEGFLWRTLPEHRRGEYAGDVEVFDSAPVYGGAKRQRIYYVGLDLVKYKANWGQTWPPSVVTP